MSRLIISVAAATLSISATTASSVPLQATLEDEAYFTSVDLQLGAVENGDFDDTLLPGGGGKAIFESTAEICCENDYTHGWASGQAILKRDTASIANVEAHIAQNAFGVARTRYVTTWVNPSYLLPAFVPDVEITLKSMELEMEGGALDALPFKIVSNVLDREVKPLFNSDAVGARIEYNVLRTTIAGNNLVHQEMGTLFGGYENTIQGRGNYKFSPDSTLMGNVRPREVIVDDVFGALEFGAIATVPDKVFTVSPGWIAPGGSTRVTFEMLAAVSSGPNESVIKARFGDPLNFNEVNFLDFTSTPEPGDSLPPAVPLPAGLLLMLSALGGLGHLQRRG